MMRMYKKLANYAMIIESHYGCPMDIEWGKNGLDGRVIYTPSET